MSKGRSRAIKTNGQQIYRAHCSGCHKIATNKGYAKKVKCDYCGFTAINRCQLDIDHIDGDHDNNDLSNFQTLCANCHRLKTLINKDYLISYN